MFNSFLNFKLSHSRASHCGRYTMKSIIILLLLSTIGCGSQEFPKDFSGNWEFDSERMFKSIEEGHWSKEEKIKLISSYGSLHNGQKIFISESGNWKTSDMPVGFSLQLSVVKNTNGKYIFETTNSMNPSEKEYTLNYINKEGVWCVEMLDSSMEKETKFPNNYWKKAGITKP